jgi:hypothetical protein
MHTQRKKYFIPAAHLAIGLAGLGALAFVFACVPARIAHAAGLTVTPAVIDDKGTPNDILQYTLTVTNTDDRLANVFASVYNLTASGTQQFVDTGIVDSSLADKSVSLANWISVARGAMTFAPGQTETIPVQINISPFAVAGTYHAVIAFVEGGTRADAETHLDGAPQAIVTLQVESNAKVELQLASFASTKPFVSAFPVTFTYALKNTGTVPATPTGQVLFYDKVGHELGSVDANPDAVTIAPGDTRNFSVTWGSGQGFGQYKAMLDVTYGAAQEDQLENVALVWVLPWQELAVWFVGLLAIVIVLAAWLHRRYERRHRARAGFIQELLARIRDGHGGHHVVDLHNADAEKKSLDLRGSGDVPRPPEHYHRHGRH